MVGNREQVRLTGDRARCRIQTGQRPAALCAVQRMQFAGAAFNYIRDGPEARVANARADTLLPSSWSPLHFNDSPYRAWCNYARLPPRENWLSLRFESETFEINREPFRGCINEDGVYSRSRSINKDCVISSFAPSTMKLMCIIMLVDCSLWMNQATLEISSFDSTYVKYCLLFELL